MSTPSKATAKRTRAAKPTATAPAAAATEAPTAAPEPTPEPTTTAPASTASVIVDEFPAAGAGNPKYPYDDWFDGQVHKLIRGQHFSVSPKAMRNVIGGYARRNGIEGVRIAQRGEDVYVQRRRTDS